MTISQSGRVRYSYFRRRSSGLSEKVVVYLTLVSDKDEQFLEEGGLRKLRLQRILRITKEAAEQGVKLGYEDLAVLLLTSLATLKRDIISIESDFGEEVPLRGRRKRSVAIVSCLGEAVSGREVYACHEDRQDANTGMKEICA